MALVWIDAREAIVVRWQDGTPRVERIDSEVPVHHRATGHGRQQTAGEPHRLEHLSRFVEQVASRLAAEDELVILGPGTVREHLQRHVREIDEGHHQSRSISCEASPKLTDRQLIARLRHIVGADPRRRTVGAYRWSEPLPRRPSGGAVPPPRRVLEKPPRDLDRWQP